MYSYYFMKQKLKVCTEATARSFWNVEGIGFSVSDYIGLSGGLIILWNSRNLEVVCSFRGAGFLGIKVLWRDNFY